MHESDGWKKWSIYVLKELERLNICYIEMSKNIEELKEDMNYSKRNFFVFKKEINIKTGIWGIIGGAVPVAVGLAYYFLH